MRAQLANTPAEVVVANHCYGLFELAAIYLSQTPPMLFQARLAIDGLGFLLDGLRGRLGEAEPSPARVALPAPPGLRAPRGCRAAAPSAAANEGQAATASGELRARPPALAPPPRPSPGRSAR